MTRICVIDIGGTNFRCGLHDGTGLAPGSVVRTETPNYLTLGRNSQRIQALLVRKIVTEYRAVVRRYGPVSALAIAFPGPVTSAGLILQSCVIFGDQLEAPFDLRHALAAELGSDTNLELLVTNDLTASAWRYADSGLDPFCLVTVSSGVGNKIFANGRVLIGDDGLAGEIGHYEADLGDVPVPCSCGTGCNHIGMISSGRGIEMFAQLLGGRGGRLERHFRRSSWGRRIGHDANRITNTALARAADQGDPFARAVVDFCTAPLARAITLLALALYLKRVILIGGFALNCQYYRSALVRHAITQGIYNATPARIRAMIVRGKPDDDHAILGLGAMVRRRDSETAQT